MDKRITIELALLAKQKGYNWSCDEYYHFTTISNPPTREITECFQNFNEYDSCLSIPTQTSLQKWLREVHAIYIWIETGSEYLQIGCAVIDGNFHRNISEGGTYEEALELALQKVLKLIKK